MHLLARISKAPVADFVHEVLNSTQELGIRYALLVGIAWLLGYVFFKRRWFHRKIVARFPKSSEVWREIGYSASSMLIFSIVGAATLYLIRASWTQLYHKLDAHSGLWFWTSIPLAAILHDTWFYWTHRLMHHPGLFRLFHRTHHLSHNPTPWAAYAFSPLEAVVQALIFPLAITLIPMHYYAFGLFMLWQISFNIIGHTGYEIFPRWLWKSPIRFVLNTPTNHIMHHETLKGNYGLYFNVWDRLMGTNHAAYETRLREIVMRGKEPRESAGEPAVPSASLS